MHKSVVASPLNQGSTLQTKNNFIVIDRVKLNSALDFGEPAPTLRQPFGLVLFSIIYFSDHYYFGGKMKPIASNGRVGKGDGY